MSNNPVLIAAAIAAEKALRNFVEVMQYPAEDWMVLAANDLAAGIAAPTCPTPWEWFTMGHPDIDKIKADGTRIMVFVSRKVLPKGALGQHLAVHPPKLAFARWVTTLVDTPAARSSRHAQALLDKHGGFWAMDRRGLKPITGAPELWCYLPDIGE